MALWACAAAFQREVRLTSAQLQERVEGLFPVERRDGFVRLTFAEPRIRLGQGERIGLQVDVTVRVPGVARVQGRMGADGRLAYDADRGEILFVDPRVVTFDVQGLPPAYAGGLRDVADAVARERFSEIPVVRLEQADFQQSLARLVLRSVQVRDGEVVATMGL